MASKWALISKLVADDCVKDLKFFIMSFITESVGCSIDNLVSQKSVGFDIQFGFLHFIFEEFKFF